jgi:AraC family transcriptional regulator
MSETPPATVDLQGEYIQHVPLLASEGWEHLQLIYEREPAGEMPENQLDRHVLIICQGNCRANYWLDGQWQAAEYTHGDSIWMPASELFPKVQLDRTVPLLEFTIEPKLIHQIAGSARAKIPPLLKFRDPLIYQMGISLQQELMTSGVDSKLYADSMSMALTTHLWRHYGDGSQPRPTGGLSVSNLRQIRDYIHSHLDAPLSLAELAALVQMHPHYFASLFKQSTGISPYRYILQHRMASAQNYLAQPNLSIVEIAQLVGFQNQSHFTRVFRQHTGVTPKVYRDRL